jgi:hypothetical protein
MPTSSLEIAAPTHRSVAAGPGRLVTVAAVQALAVNDGAPLAVGVAEDGHRVPRRVVVLPAAACAWPAAWGPGAGGGGFYAVLCGANNVV